MNYQARAHFGLPADPWSGRHIATSDALRAKILVSAAADAQSMVRIVGPRGAGKSLTVRHQLESRPGLRVVEPLRLDRERLHLGDIQHAIVRDLSDERPRMSGEARSGQVQRILGTLAGRPPVLLIDDAHVLRVPTVKGLKRLRELGYRGRTALIGVVLVGQADPAASTPEVALRSDRFAFAGLTSDDVIKAVAAAVGAVVRHDAIRAIAESERARNWLDLQTLVDECLAHAAARDASAESVTADDVRAVLSPDTPAATVPLPKGSADRAAGSVLGRRRSEQPATAAVA